MIGKHVYAAISSSIVIVVCAWFATATSWDLFGDEETLLDASVSDTGDVQRSGRARPYEQRDEGGGER